MIVVLKSNSQVVGMSIFENSFLKKSRLEFLSEAVIVSIWS